jgi:ribonuclease Z
MSLNGREDELTIYGPKGIVETVRSILGLGYFKSGYRVAAAELEPGAVLEFGTYMITCASAEHSVPSLAFSLEEKARPGRFNLSKARQLGIPEGPLYRRLQEGKTVTVKGRVVQPEEVLGPARKGRKVVYTGDTRPSANVVQLAKDADVLIHDSTLDSEHSALAASFGHSTAAEAAQVAKDAGVRMLFLVHLSPRYDDATILEEEARRIFKHSKVPGENSEHVVRYRD